MKAPSRSLSVAGPAILLALFAVGVAAARALALPLPAAIVGLGLVLLGLRVGVMAASLDVTAEAPARPGKQDAPAPLRVANG